MMIGSSFSCSNDKSPSLEEFEKAASVKIKTLATQLKTELSTSMQSGGPISAIDTCRIKAPEIASRLNSADAVKIKRTSLRLRNPNNIPDQWERETLMSFEQALSSGKAIKEMVHSEKVSSEDHTTLRFMRAIPVQPVCLSCHGDKQTMSKELIDALHQHYPNDSATGFNVGQIRGAFSVIQTIPH